MVPSYDKQPCLARDSRTLQVARVGDCLRFFNLDAFDFGCAKGST
jgi:hypothetical protein